VAVADAPHQSRLQAAAQKECVLAATEAAAIPWRRRADEDALRRDGRRWTMWTAGVVATFGAPAAAVIALEPLTAPVALMLAAHGGAVLHIQAGRGARAVVPIGSERSAANRERSEPEPERAAIGLLGDLLGHSERELLAETGLALQRGRMGVWLVGEEGALMVRPGGRRVDCWCVRVSEAGDLPAGDRVAHLLLALREDERGFATVANFNFSGAYARVAVRTPKRSRPALEAARGLAREMS
jgi:hypothetical protein